MSIVQATPELEYGRMNIGSRPSKRKPSGGIESLRAIPWIFAWTQTRFHLPVWLGLGGAFKHALNQDMKNLATLRKMYDQWPFFRVTVDLIEMVFAKGDPGIAALYDRLLVKDELKQLGKELRSKYEETKKLLLQVSLSLSLYIYIYQFQICTNLNLLNLLPINIVGVLLLNRLLDMRMCWKATQH
jgi:phosphoenolpyruvate carboxylase